MKSFLEVEKERIAYHKQFNKNTVHRSSLLVPKFENVISNLIDYLPLKVSAL